jgi:hypothetical protein
MTQTELQSASSYNNLRCQTILSKCTDAIRLFRGLVKPSPDDNWMRDYHPSLGRSPIDPDVEERRDQRIGNWIVFLANGGAAALCLGAFYVGMLWLSGGS